MFVTKFENKTYGIQHNLRDLFSVEKVKSEYKSSSKNIYKGKISTQIHDLYLSLLSLKKKKANWQKTENHNTFNSKVFIA